VLPLIQQAVTVWTLVGGGTIDQAGLYRAPMTSSGPALVVAAHGTRDTALVRITAGGGTLGIPFGHFKEPDPGTLWRSGGDLIVPQGELAKLPMIRARGGRVMVNVVGGGKCSLDSLGQWQMVLWQACWRKNLTPALRDTVLAYAAAGVVVGDYLIDEPNLVKRWGVITPADVCRMAEFARVELPGIPVLVRAAPAWLGTCPMIDAAWAQYGSRRQVPVDDYRDEHVVAAKARGYQIVFSLNALNDDALGTPMTPAQVMDYGTELMDSPLCYFMVWEYATTWSERPEIRAALDSLGRIAATRTPKDCRRPM
jgi:hypothetical protein